LTVCVVSAEVPIARDEALHLRPLVELVARAQQFKSRVVISRGKRSADAKEMMPVIQLAPEHGGVRLQAEGEDAREVIAALAAIIDQAVQRVMAEEAQPQNGAGEGTTRGDP